MTQEERNEQSMAKIFHAAIREFGKYGYSKSSLNRICREGNLSKGRLYYYFPDKTALFYACVYRVYGEFTDFMEHFRPEPTATIEQNFHDYFRRRQYFFLQNPYYPLIGAALRRSFKLPEDPTGRVQEYVARYNVCNDRIIHAIFQLYSPHLVPDIDLATEVVHVAVNRINLDYGFSRWDPENPSEELFASNLQRFDRLIHLLLYGVLNREQ